MLTARLVQEQIRARTGFRDLSLRELDGILMRHLADVLEYPVKVAEENSYGQKSDQADDGSLGDFVVGHGKTPVWVMKTVLFYQKRASLSGFLLAYPAGARMALKSPKTHNWQGLRSGAPDKFRCRTPSFCCRTENSKTDTDEKERYRIDKAHGRKP